MLLLPTKSLENVGVQGTMKSLGLADNMPACHDYDPLTEEFRWAEGYEDGGAHVAQRKFPVMYFDGLGFPERSTVGWLGAKDLAPFDTKSHSIFDIPHIQVVWDYQRNRAPAPPTKKGEGASDSAGTS